MEKNAILKQRKELKKNGHRVVRGHYITLFFLTLVMILFGTEYSYVRNGWGPSALSENDAQEEDVGSVLDSGTVLGDIMSGQLFEGRAVSQQLEGEILENGDVSRALGRTRGVLAQAVNALTSGKLYAMFGNAVYTIVKSQDAVAVVFILLSLAWYAVIYILVRGIYSAVYRRVFLVARVYESISPSDVLHFAAVRRWFRAAWTMMVMEFYLLLWTLTVIGGFIKSCSYFAVPYIVAENPGVRARDAIRLSRKMMNGHKMELFLFQLSMIGWRILGLITFGISEYAYGVAYRTACETEFYAKIREAAIRGGIEGCALLNDPYLYEKADRVLLYETYFDVVDEITLIHEQKIELTGIRRIMSDWFGIWWGTLSGKNRYDELEGRKYAIRHARKCMLGEAYPQWLNPLWRRKEIAKSGNFSFLRSYSIWTLFLLFISFSFLGWTWEVALHYMQAGELVNRGTLLGPWLPIYGTGGVIVLILCARFRRNPVLEFFTAIVLCGMLEYYSAWYLETKFHRRWWSYDGYFLNLHGRICAEGLLVFGVGCCIVVYMAAPLFDMMLSKVKTGILIPLCIVLGVLFGTDQIHSSFHPNMAKGAVEADDTEAQGQMREQTQVSS
ncbi:MAG: DUF975 family protein [Lachnospiraceae bacterium]|nr:DUF975 family protein [Lachnospiraceae bacterium]